MPQLVQYINERSENIVRYSDKLSEALNKIDDYFEVIGPKAGIKFNDPENFFEESKEQIGKIIYRLSVRKDWGLYALSDCEYIDPVLIANASRAMKKAAVKRLPEFVALYAESLKKYEQEYEEISKKAAQMAVVLSA
ncbi:MAG TPA: hypothetical protein VN455_05620 [Methanotrichaceae archaeon]|nr:hypothetical protein [Methanotrichaceae archaeon]